MNELNDIISFYKDCYRSDYKAVSVPNFFGRNVEIQYHLISFEPINGRIPNYPVDQQWGKIMDEALAIHSKEKGLYTGSFFLKGKMIMLGKTHKVLVPLYLHETNLNYQNEFYAIELDLQNPIINPSFLDLLKSINPNVVMSYDELVDLLPHRLDFEGLVELKKIFSSLFPFLDNSEIDLRLKTEVISTDLKAIFQSRSTDFESKIFAASSIGLINKPKGSRGIINELEILSKSKVKSKTLNSLFYKSQESKDFSAQRTIHVPASLSTNQKQVFFSLDAYDATLVVGPPGTGKSFTIAGITTELISQGKSVLVASKNDQAGKVIAKKIENDFGLHGLVIKTSHGSYRRRLKTRLKNILNGIVTNRVNRFDLIKSNSELNTLNSEIFRLEKLMISREKEEIKWGNFYYDHRDSFFNNLKSKWFEYQHSKSLPIWRIKKTLDFKNKIRIKKIRKYIQHNYNYHLYNNLLSKRKEIVTLIHALSEKSGNKIHEKFDQIDFNLVLKALPAWVCNTSDIHNILPLKEELFDVLIIDEASQCDIASSLPLFYRAKKVLIVGDPKQLRHISFLSKYQQNIFRKKYNINNEIPDYRKTSILDLVSNTINNQDQVVFLDEHYRSAPDIIRFSNKKFYSNKLKIMTETPTSLLSQNLFLNQVNGTQDKKGQNQKEVSAITQQVAEIIQNEIDLPKDACQSIGIISPFRAQITLLQSTIKKTFPLSELKKHDFLIGTPYHFQGEERDIILLSFAVDNETHPSTFIYLNKEDVFNVSITRARKKQILYSSINHRLLNPDYLITQYLDEVGRIISKTKEPNKYFDEFAEEVKEKLLSIGIDKILESFPIAGVVVDLVVAKNDKTFCIDLIGYPGEFEEQFTQEKIQRLNRMNHPIFFIPYSTWHLDGKECLKNLNQFLNS